MPRRLPLLADLAKSLIALPDRTSHALLLRDLDAWTRIEVLGMLSSAGIAGALVGGATLGQIADAAEVTDRELLAAVLALGVATGEVRQRGDRYEIRGRRLRAVTGRSVGLAGMVEECHLLSGPVYPRIADHLRGAPPADYMDGMGGVVARSSRLIEPFVGPIIRSIVTSVGPSTVLDVGCGSGAYLRHVHEAAPGARVVGIDADEGAVAEAKSVVADHVDIEVRHADVDDLDPSVEGPYDLVLLLNNLYYWPVDERPALLERLRALAPGGTVVVAIPVTGPGMHPVTAQLDVELRIMQGAYPAPRSDELDALLAASPFSTVERVEPVPKLGLAVAVCS